VSGDTSQQRYRNGRFRAPRPVDQAPLLHETESARAARVLAAASVAKRRRDRSAYVKAHCAALLASIERAASKERKA
jgi:hypothetical protein